MNNWFTAKVRYTKQMEDSTFKRISEPYLVSALTFSDAETRIYDELGSSIRGEFKITGCTPTNYDDVVTLTDVDYFFEAKVRMNVADMDATKPKMVTKKILVSGADISDAFDNLKEVVDKYVTDVEVIGISKTQIVDIFPFKETEETTKVETKEMEEEF